MGTDSLPAALFFHPQNIEIRNSPAVDNKIAPGNNLAVAVSNLEYDQFILDRIFKIYL
jgi:hypothetical protein